MHAQGVAHLDLSLCNVLTDLCGHYAYIDFELSRRFDKATPVPRLTKCRGSAIPPDVERGADSDPFKMDIWALGTLILHICQVCVVASVFLEIQIDAERNFVVGRL